MLVLIVVQFLISDDMYGHYASSAGYTYHHPVAHVPSVADMIPPPPPPPGEGPLEGMLHVPYWDVAKSFGTWDFWDFDNMQLLQARNNWNCLLVCVFFSVM